MIFEIDYSPHIIQSEKNLRRIQKSLLCLNTQEAIELADQTIAELRLLRASLHSERPCISQKPSPD